MTGLNVAKGFPLPVVGPDSKDAFGKLKDSEPGSGSIHAGKSSFTSGLSPRYVARSCAAKSPAPTLNRGSMRSISIEHLLRICLEASARLYAPTTTIELTFLFNSPNEVMSLRTRHPTAWTRSLSIAGS